MTAPVRNASAAAEPELVKVSLGTRSYDIVIGRGIAIRSAHASPRCGPAPGLSSSPTKTSRG